MSFAARPNIMLRDSWWKWIILMCSGFAFIGEIYSYQEPISISKQMITVLKINNADFSWIYSVYAFPNMVLPIFAGVIIDTMGLRYSIFLFYFICLIGNLIFAIGGSYKSYTTILIGRCIFGIGNETCMQSVLVLVTKWFISGRLNLAYALNGMASGFASMASGITAPIIFGSMKDPHLGKCLMLGFWLNFICTIFLGPTLYIDYKDDKQLEAIQEDKIAELKKLVVEAENYIEEELEIKKKTNSFKCSDLKKYDKAFWINCLNGCL
jgi:MFS family permease